MLITEPIFVERGVPVFPDHADPNQFWYLPADLAIATDAGGRPIFSFISYRGNDARSSAGGFLSFQVSLRLADRKRDAILEQLPDGANLAQVPFTDGTVTCLVLDSQTGPAPAPTPATPATPSTLVSRVIGAGKPSLIGDNAAIFTVSLSPAGATLVKQALLARQPVLGVIYELSYMAMQPPLQVVVDAHLKQIYDFLSAGAMARYSFLRAELGASLEYLRQTSALTIKKIDTEGSAASGAELDAAMRLFTDKLLADWFKPDLIPGMTRAPQAMPFDPMNPMTYNQGYGTPGMGMMGGMGMGGMGYQPGRPYVPGMTPGYTPGLTPGYSPFSSNAALNPPYTPAPTPRVNPTPGVTPTPSAASQTFAPPQPAGKPVLPP